MRRINALMISATIVYYFIQESNSDEVDNNDIINNENDANNEIIQDCRMNEVYKVDYYIGPQKMDTITYLYECICKGDINRSIEITTDVKNESMTIWKYKCGSTCKEDEACKTLIYHHEKVGNLIFSFEQNKTHCTCPGNKLMPNQRCIESERNETVNLYRCKTPDCNLNEVSVTLKFSSLSEFWFAEETIQYCNCNGDLQRIEDDYINDFTTADSFEIHFKCNPFPPANSTS